MPRPTFYFLGYGTRDGQSLVGVPHSACREGSVWFMIDSLYRRIGSFLKKLCLGVHWMGIFFTSPHKLQHRGCLKCAYMARGIGDGGKDGGTSIHLE